MKKIIRLGSRGSPLALLQAEEVRRSILSAHPDLSATSEIEIVPIRTSGDWRPEQKELSFRELGGNKELFTKEIEEALIGNFIDLAVHSMKDVASTLPHGLEISALLPRVDPRDAFISHKARTVDELPEGAVVGTSSLRRQAQILARRPDLKIVPLRGNVETRLKKLEQGMADATLLAMAGLIRLGLHNLATSLLEPETMLPAAAQGAIGIEIRADDRDMRQMLVPLHTLDTAVCVDAERAFLRVLDGNCHTPIGALAYMTGPDQMKLEGMAANADGTSVTRMDISGALSSAENLGIALGHRMKAQLPANFYAA